MTLKKLKKSLCIAALITLVLGTVFTFCHVFASDMGNMNETSARDSRSTSPVISNSASGCCQSQGAGIIFHTAVNSILSNKVMPVNPSLLILLSLSLLYFLALVDQKKFIKIHHYTRHLKSKLSNYLSNLLSQGILQPKLYNI